MHYKKQCNREQMILFNSLDDAISPDHPIRVINVLIDSIIENNPDKFIYKGKENIGQKAYSPAIYLKLYLYGYLNNINSSRKLEKETNRNIEVKWLLGDLQPDFKSIADYRKDNRQQIEFVTKEIRKFLKRFGLIKGDFIAIDGTKIKANTKRDMRNYKKISKQLLHIDKEMKEYLLKLSYNDELKEGINTTPSKENKNLIDKIAKLQEKILELNKEKELLEKSGKKQISKTDVEASLMITRNGKLPAYNVQCGVDSENMLIVSMYPTESPTDMREMSPMIEKIKEEYGEVPSIIVGDKGYNNFDELMKIETDESNQDIECVTPIIERAEDKEEIQFRYDKSKDEYICSAGKRLKLFTRNKKLCL